MMGALESQDTAGFIRKVYSILAFQMVVTTLLVGYDMLNPDFIKFQTGHMLIFWLALGVSIGAEITLLCCRHIARTVPINYVLLLLVTLG